MRLGARGARSFIAENEQDSGCRKGYIRTIRCPQADALLEITVTRAPRVPLASLPSPLRLGAGRGTTRPPEIDACFQARAPKLLASAAERD